MAIAKRRSYRQFCGAAKALDVVGERWTLLIVRDLLLGPRRYTELHRALPGITTNLLAKRLAEMEAAQLIERRSEHGVQLWALTPTGEALEPVVLELGRFGWRYLDRPRRGERVDIGWALVALKRRYRGGLERLPVELSVVERGQTRRFVLEGRGPRLSVREAAVERAGLRVRGPVEAVRAWLFLGHDPDDLLRSGALERAGEGDLDAAWRALRAAFAPLVAGDTAPGPLSA
jgi:DNA-binding HxlR family transcriptional regulator